MHQTSLHPRSPPSLFLFVCVSAGHQHEQASTFLESPPPPPPQQDHNRETVHRANGTVEMNRTRATKRSRSQTNGRGRRDARDVGTLVAYGGGGIRAALTEPELVMKVCSG